MAVTDYQDWMTPEHHALTIYQQRVPLARNSTILASASGATLNQGATITLLAITSIDQPSLEFGIVINNPLNQGLVPFGEVTIDWLDSTGTFIIERDECIIPFGNGPGLGITIGATMPCRAENVRIQLTSFETQAGINATYSFTANVISHVFDRARWRQSTSPSAPNTLQYPFQDPGRGLIAWTNPTIAPGILFTRLLPVYAGKTRWQVNNTAQPNALAVTVTETASVIPPIGATYKQISVAAGAVADWEMNLPFGPLTVGITNTGGAGNVVPIFYVHAEEY